MLPHSPVAPSLGATDDFITHLGDSPADRKSAKFPTSSEFDLADRSPSMSNIPLEPSLDSTVSYSDSQTFPLYVVLTGPYLVFRLIQGVRGMYFFTGCSTPSSCQRSMSGISTTREAITVMRLGVRSRLLLIIALGCVRPLESTFSRD